MTSPTLDISADEFRVWLEARRGDIVGRARGWCDCPIANWLSGKAGRTVSVSSGEFTELGLGDRRRGSLPAWARRFISEADRDPGAPIDGETALSILAGALRSR